MECSKTDAAVAVAAAAEALQTDRIDHIAACWNAWRQNSDVVAPRTENSRSTYVQHCTIGIADVKSKELSTFLLTKGQRTHQLHKYLMYMFNPLTPTVAIWVQL